MEKGEDFHGYKDGKNKTYKDRGFNILSFKKDK